MAVAPRYSLVLDPRTWLPVPLRFPWGEFADADSWAAELADSLLGGVGIDEDGVTMLRETALTLQQSASPLPGAQERFWRTENVGGAAIVAHLYISPSEARGEEDLLQLARAGIGGTVQTWQTFVDTAFDTAVEAVIVAEVGDRTIGALRYLGLRDGFIFVLDLIDEDLIVLEAVQDETAAIFRSVTFA